MMARKPYSLEDLKEQIDREITPIEACNMVRTHHTVMEAFGCWRELWKANLSGNRWWRIVLEEEQVELLIETQGFDYPRYAGILDAEATKLTTFKD